LGAHPRIKRRERRAGGPGGRSERTCLARCSDPPVRLGPPPRHATARLARRKSGVRATLRVVGSLASFPAMMQRDRERQGLRVCRAAWLIGVSVREYREIEAGERGPEFETWRRMCDVFNWPLAFARNA